MLTKTMYLPRTGLVSNKGQYPPARDASLDACLVAGPMCRYAEDLAPMLSIMAGSNRELLRLGAKVLCQCYYEISSPCL